MVTLHGFRLPPFPLFVAALVDNLVQLVVPFAEKLAERLAHGQRIEAAVELAVVTKLEAGYEGQKLGQLDVTVLGGEQFGELRQGVHVSALLCLRSEVKRGQLGLYPKGGCSGSIQAVNVGYDRRFLAVDRLWT